MKLGDIADRITRKNANLESNLPLTISAQYGLIDQNEFFDKRIASKDISGYYLLRKGEYAYNKSTSNDAPWGAVKRLEKYDKGVVSTLYIVFSLRSNIDSDYFATYYSTDRWHRGIQEIASEGARNHGLLNIAPNDFFNTAIKAPKSLDEQKKIGSFFQSLDAMVALHQRKLDKLQAIKKSLLQKMFPAEGEDRPQIRFAGYTDAWGQERLDQLFVNSGSGGTPLATNPNFYNGPIPFLGIADITDREITSTKKSITELGLKNSAAWIVPAGSVSLAMYASVGKVGITTKDLATSQAFYNMVFDDDFLRDFVYTRLEKADMDREWEALISTGTQRNLNAEKVRAFTIDVPSHGEMIKIAGFFKNIDSLLSLHQRKLEKLQQIKKALLEQMFC